MQSSYVVGVAGVWFVTLDNYVRPDLSYIVNEALHRLCWIIPYSLSIQDFTYHRDFIVNPSNKRSNLISFLSVITIRLRNIRAAVACTELHQPEKGTEKNYHSVSHVFLSVESENSCGEESRKGAICPGTAYRPLVPGSLREVSSGGVCRMA